MNETARQDLFEIRLTDSGKFYIRKFANTARVAIVFAILIALINVAVIAINTLKIPLASYANDRALLLEHKLLPYYTALYCLLNFPLLFFYWQVTKYLRKALKQNDEEMFNKAFHALYRNSVFAMAAVMLSTLNYGFELYWYVKHYLK